MVTAPTVMTYLTQLCKTATDGKVVVEKAWITNRLKFYCTVCDQTLTTSEPKLPTEVDYQVQEFISIHSHKGGHCAHKWSQHTMQDGVVRRICHRCQLVEEVEPLGVVPLPKPKPKPLKISTGRKFR